MEQTNYCVMCRKVTQQKVEKLDWYGNSKKFSCHLICQECYSVLALWLEDKE